MTIYIITHKSIDLVDMDNYQKLLVGANFSKINSNNFVLDNTGEDNISYKNKNYCELTAMYWAWKNIKKIYPELEYIGLNHYRRYFFMEKKTFVKDLFIRPENEVGEYVLRRDSFKNNLYGKW